MGATQSTRRTTAAPPASGANGAAGAAAAPPQPRGAYPGQQASVGAYPGQSAAGRIPMQMQQFYLEGMRPENNNGILPRGPAIPHPPQMQKTYTIRNDVNLKKPTLKLVRDGASSTKYHLEFTFDASTECGITVYYAATEMLAADHTVRFKALKPHGALPKEYREKGLGQSYRTPAANALDLSQYAVPEDLSNTHSKGCFPIIVCLEAGGPTSQTKSAVSSQTTFANITFGDGGVPTVVPLKQKIQVDQTSYELQEIYGIDGAATTGTSEADAAAAESSSPAGAEGAENSRECVICMTEPRDTTVLPCRHMCMCSDCAKVLRMQSEKCPICRTPIEQLLQIKISSKQGAEAPSA